MSYVLMSCHTDGDCQLLLGFVFVKIPHIYFMKGLPAKDESIMQKHYGHRSRVKMDLGSRNVKVVRLGED